MLNTCGWMCTDILCVCVCLRIALSFFFFCFGCRCCCCFCCSEFFVPFVSFLNCLLREMYTWIIIHIINIYLYIIYRGRERESVCVCVAERVGGKELTMSSDNKGKKSGSSHVRPVISSGGFGRLHEDGAARGEDGSTPQITDADDFVGALAVFEREIRGLAEKLADERHSRDNEASSVLQTAHDALVVERDGEQRSFSTMAELGGRMETRATTRSPPSAVARKSVRPPPPTPSIRAPSVKNGAGDKRKATNPSHDASCVRAVALDVWATLGFFSLPPFGADLPAEWAGGHTWRSLRSDMTEFSAPSVERSDEEEEGEENEESIFGFVEALVRYYQREMTAMGGVSGNAEEPLSEEMLRNGLWQVVFNALFYCVTVPSSDLSLTSRDLESLSCGVEDRYDDAYTSSSSSLSSEKKEGRGGKAQEGENTGCRCLPTKLHWSTRAASKGMNKNRLHEQQERSGCGLERRLGHATPRGSRRHAELDEVVEEGRQSSFSSSKRGELVDGRRRRSTPFGDRLAVPPTIKLWYFVVRTFARLGYRRDAFYVQTPLRGSIHELLLSLLWLTKEYRLVAVAEYVQLQSMYGFLLQQGPVIHDGSSHSNEHHCNPNDDGFGRGAEKGYVSSAQPQDPEGESLLRCFPAAVPWPPASFVEKEHIAHRLEQIRQILPTLLDEKNAPMMRLPDLTRRLLSMRHLITLSMNRLECALHQRTEQTVSLGLHSVLDAQLCHPTHHGVYRQLCGGLQHLLGMEARVRETTQQLFHLGSLVARAVGLEEASLRQQRLHATALKALEDDEMTWWQPSQDGEGESEACARGNLSDVLVRFRATGAREHLTDLWASLRRRAQVGGGRRGSLHGTREHITESAAMQAQLEEKVRQNMETHYALHAALKAELLKWQFSRAKKKQDVDDERGKDDDSDGNRFALTNGEERGKILHAPRGLDNRSGDAHLKKKQMKVRPPFVSFDLVTNHISPHRPQATAVGQPAENATTSACLEIERLQEALYALDQQEEYREKCAEERRLQQDAVQLLHQQGLRVVHRRR
ncbi:hypothetical protein MOQ_001003 [Trypanosoma cruzi marinkellei]|uniref:Uncharacterized protein n=1 Tax=Trypanosoma cruzi marinkellei TaxID=85056 RepID=K2MU42_TRYCR|nr:hypothetical protein MOQ_001003 [Trypanosoma cruzi marinkellei]